VEKDIEIKYRQADITPFWKKLPFFFLFPFRFGPAVFLACLVGASALAGLALGSFGLAFKGFLVYLGLRYAFNVLELFSKGRFEGESVDHRLWGPEKRPAKLGAVLALFIVIGASLGNVAVGNRLANDTAAQDRVVAQYRITHDAELAELEREQAEWRRQNAEAQAAAQSARAVARKAIEEGRDTIAPEDIVAEELPAPTGLPSRAEMVERAAPEFGTPLWFGLQPGWYWFVMLVLSLLLPSAAITIALEDNLPRALNPFLTLNLVQAMGKAYFTLWAFFLAIAGSRQLALTAGASLPPALRFPLEMLFATYLGLVLFAVMGYALYQYHQELHLEVDVDFDRHREAGGAEAIATAGSARAAVQKASPPQDPWERKVHDLAAQGNFRDAIAEVKDRMRYDRHDVAMNAKLHALLLQQGEAAATLAHGQQYLTALRKAGKSRELVEVVRKLLALDANFVVEDGDVVFPAASAAMQQGDVQLATGLLRSFDRRFPKHADTAGVFFLGARLLSEQSRQHDKALKILRAVLHHFPDHAVAVEARTYLTVLEKMVSQQQQQQAPATA
jgi:tetratricopeptide (TPR) repeat protein